MKQVREWTLLEEIGRGGMGVIYRAQHALMEGEFALKRIHPSLIVDAEIKGRFLREVRLSTALRHPNIVRCELPFIVDEDVYLPMELLRGCSLREALACSAAEPWPWAVEVIRQAAAGLAHAHALERPLIHRDVKPSNLYLHEGEGDEVRVKILDFGLSKRAGDASLTHSQGFVGTLNYMAPEQLRGEPATPASDVFALGLILYQSLVGRRPFELPSQLHLMMLKLVEIYRDGFESSPCRAGVDAPPWLDALTRSMLSLDPARRPQNGLEVLLELSGRAPPEESGLHLDPFDSFEGELPQPQRRGLWTRIKEGDEALLEQMRVRSETRIEALQRDKRRLVAQLVRLKAQEFRHQEARIRAEREVSHMRSSMTPPPLDEEASARFEARIGELQEALKQAEARAAAQEASRAKAYQILQALGLELDRAHAARRKAEGDREQLKGQLEASAAEVRRLTEALESREVACEEKGAALKAEIDRLRASLQKGTGRKPEPEVRAWRPPHVDASKPKIDWVLIPGGVFKMGDDRAARGDERPERLVKLSPFYVSRGLITVAQYAAAVEARIVAAPMPFDERAQEHMNWGRDGRARHPINGVPWGDAVAFARWLGGALPSEAQWEYAAKGGGGRRYPWGSAKPDCNRAVMARCTTGTLEIGARPAGYTKQGLWDMCGALWEWVMDRYHASYTGAPKDGSAWIDGGEETRVLRGGSWRASAEELMNTYRAYAAPTIQRDDVGFRIVKPA